MSQFAQDGSASIDGGDRGFVSINQRLQLNQLEGGEVRESLNGRMEGYWKPRRNVVSKTGALTSGQTTLRLPFLLIDSVKTISAAVYSSNLVTITVTGHGFASGSSGYATVAGLTFTGTDNNGPKVLTYAGVNTLTFPVSGVTNVNGTGTLSQMAINDNASSNVRASCLFSDPNNSNKEYAIIALDTVAKKVDLNGYAITDIQYPSGEILGKDTEMIQVFDKVMLFRDGKQALEWYPNGRPIISASQSGTVVTMNVKEHGLVTLDSVVISGLTGGSTPANGPFVVTVTGQDTFTYTFSTSQTVSSFGVTNSVVNAGFNLSPGGAYTQPQTFIVAGTNIAASNGLVTIDKNTLGNTTITKGNIIVIYETTIDEFASIVGKEFEVVSANTTTVTFYAPVGTKGSFTGSLQFGGRFSVGGGFMHQPGAPWGVHFQRRLWVPYYYDQSGAYNGASYTSRKIADEIAVSDILDTTTFDQIENQFRISGGTADYVVGMHGFYDDGLVVLNRNSLHIIKGTQGSLRDVVVKELTSEVGCLSRKSVVMRGSVMFFLSDDGVYGIEFFNDYNLRGSEQPISKNIQPYIDRINVNYANGSIGVIFKNRYYLAVPLDSARGAGDAYGNNTILVYNFLNNGWESLDTFGDSRFFIKNFIVGSADDRDNIYAVTSNGGLHQIEASESSNDSLNIDNSANVVSPLINSSLTTRGYDLGTMDRKRFTDAQINIQSLVGQNSEYDVAFSAEDPDNAQSIGTTTTLLGGLLIPTTNSEAETASIRCRLGGTRGFTGTMILTRTIGSPKINSVKITGSITNRQIISQK